MDETALTRAIAMGAVDHQSIAASGADIGADSYLTWNAVHGQIGMSMTAGELEQLRRAFTSGEPSVALEGISSAMQPLFSAGMRASVSVLMGCIDYVSGAYGAEAVEGMLAEVRGFVQGIE